MEETYKDLKDDEPVKETTTQAGWFGFTSQYWLTALIFGDQKEQEEATIRFSHVEKNETDFFQADYLLAEKEIAPYQQVMVSNRIFVGAKENYLLDYYGKEYSIPEFDLAIDFGWFYFLTKPFERILVWLYHGVGNFGIAIIIFTIVLRLFLYPLANKSFKSMSQMKKLQPEIKKLQERYGSDRMRLQQEMAGLYQKHKINPLAGCLPVLIQIPIFFSLYKVLLISIEMRQAPFFGWLKDLSAPDPTSIFNLFGLLPYEVWDWLPHLGLLPILMGVSMWIQQKLNPAPTEAIQAKVMMLLPFIFTFLLGSFPAGLVLYWTVNNMLSMIQQRIIMRKMGV